MSLRVLLGVAVFSPLPFQDAAHVLNELDHVVAAGGEGLPVPPHTPTSPPTPKVKPKPHPPPTLRLLAFV